jgi:hypothetical protein
MQQKPIQLSSLDQARVQSRARPEIPGLPQPAHHVAELSERDRVALSLLLRPEPQAEGR